MVVAGSDNFREQLAGVKKDLKPMTAIDLVGGKATGELLSAVAPSGTLHVAGNMSLRPITDIDDRAMRYEDKHMVGFYLYRAWGSLPDSARIQMLEDLQSRYRVSLGTSIAGEYPLAQFEHAIAEYKASMTTGKRLIAISHATA